MKNNPNSYRPLNFNDLYEAATSNNTTEFMRIVNILAQDPDGFNIQDKYGATPLRYAVQFGNPEMVQALLDKGAAGSTNIQDNRGSTPLHLATYKGNPEMVQALLKAGAEDSINMRNKYGSTPLDYAVVEHKNTAMAESLIRAGAHINCNNKHGPTLLHWAIKENQPDMVQALIDAGATKNSINQPIDGWTPLHLAARESNTEMVEALLKAGAKDSINMPIEHGWTPLHFAARNSNTEMVKALIEAGATESINMQIRDGWTPLHGAARYGTPEMVEALLKAGANKSINMQNKDGSTPLHLAAEYDNPEIVTALLKAGAKDSINMKDLNGKTPLQIAAECARIETIRCLLAHVDQTPEQMLTVYKWAKGNDTLSNTDIKSLHPYTSQGRMLLAGVTTVQVTAAIGAIATSITFMALSAPLLPILAPIIGGLIIFGLASIAKKSIQQNSIKPEYRTQPADEKKPQDDLQSTGIEKKCQNYSQDTSVESTDRPPFPNLPDLNNESGEKTHSMVVKARPVTSDDFDQAPEAEWTPVQTAIQIDVNSGRSIATQIAWNAPPPSYKEAYNMRTS